MQSNDIEFYKTRKNKKTCLQKQTGLNILKNKLFIFLQF